MTYEEVKRIRLNPTAEDVDNAELHKMIDVAIEKQIPKKPKILKVHDILNYKYGDCECGEHLCDDDKYCSNCGQALDWGDCE